MGSKGHLLAYTKFDCIPQFYLTTPVSGQALPAVNRAIRAGLKRDFGFLTAVVTDDREHLPRGSLPEVGALATPTRLATLPTWLAPSWLVVKPLGGKEFLLAGCERERLIAVAALNDFVFVHDLSV